jgi:N-methylhydantoinase B
MPGQSVLKEDRRRPAPTIDPVILEIIRHGLISAANEMKINLTRTAYNTVIYEVLDFSVGLFDREGNMVAQTSGLPIFLGNLGEAIRVLLRDVGESTLKPGDIYLTNDSYAVGSHLNDVNVIEPIFDAGTLLGFAVSRAHWIDIGGRDPGGWFSDTTEIYQEGIRLRSVKLYAAGEVNPSVLRMIEDNIRYADSVMGDLRAQIASCHTGRERFLEIVTQHGRDKVTAAIAEIQRQAEATTRAAIRAMKGGVYTAESFMDDDGVAVDRPAVKVTVTVADDMLTIDLTGSAAQVKGPINLGLPGTISACRVALKCLTSPHSPVAEGAFAPLRVIVPEDCMFNAKPPAPCAVWIIAITLIDTIFKALSKALPSAVPAGQYGDVAAIFIFGTNPRDRRPYLIVEPEGGGWGAFRNRDGESVLIAIADGDTRNIPVEVLEKRYPLQIVQYAVRPNSGGPGQFRGGLGHFRDIRIVNHQAKITATLERSKCPPWGLNGGSNGVPNVLIINPGTSEERSYQKVSALPLADGDVVSVCTGGGGGYGDPRKRDPRAVREDALDGYISAEAARSVYGVALMGTDFRIDESETRDLRRNDVSARSRQDKTTGS